jgi:general secretion pathway protein D
VRHFCQFNTARWSRAGISIAAVAVLAGCAQQWIRNEATTKLREGNYEAAVQELEGGVARYPDSPTLRAGLVSARAEVIARLVAEASRQRAQGRFDEAEKTLQRGLALDPKNDRLLALKADMSMERRVQRALDETKKLIDENRKAEALRVVESALRDAPRQSALLALQRRLEAELRFDSGASGRRGLAETRPITLDFRGAALSAVLEAITRGSGVNFILDRDVRQDSRVTLYLRSATVEDAIELVVGAHHLARRVIDPQTVLIYPNTPEKQREHQEQVIRVFHLAHAEAKATAALLRNMLRLKDPFVDERANLVALRESPEIIAVAERLVALHDTGDAEVMLEVEILEIKSTRLTELGINFPSSFSLTPLGPATGGDLTLRNARDINSERIALGVSGLLVNLRREVGDFNILANPRIRSKNREKARILIGDKVPVITSTANATGFVSEGVSYLDVGLKLDVEPVVSPDDEVTIKLGLEVSSIAKEVRSPGGSVAYQLGTRNANTTLRLRDGETQFLAGLISNEDRSSANRIPGLGDLPVAGRLFSSQKDDVQRTELVLAITPRILRAAPRPNLAQAEMWVGSELATRLRPSPSRIAISAVPVSQGPAQAAAGQTTAFVPGTKEAAQEALPAGPVRLAWQAPGDVKVGDEFTVTLNVASATPLRGAPVELGFSSASLEVVDVMEGSFFKQGDGTTSFTHAVNSASNRISAGILGSNPAGTVGQGSLLQLRLKAKTPGSASLAVTALKPIALGGVPAVGDLPVLKLEVK